MSRVALHLGTISRSSTRISEQRQLLAEKSLSWETPNSALCRERREARRDALGRYVPLSEQPVEGWDRGAIEEAERLLEAAGALGAPGRFQLEAAVQSVHAARRLTGKTDWEAIGVLYDALFALTASPVVAVNRAAAVAHARGADAGLKLLNEVAAEGGLAGIADGSRRQAFDAIGVEGRLDR